MEKITLNNLIKKKELEIEHEENFISDRDEILWEIYGDLKYDATIAFDQSYLQERFEVEEEKLDNSIKDSEKRIAVLKSELVFIRALNNASKHVFFL